MAYLVCDNTSMYLKTHKRKKNGKINEYYSIVEKRKVANGFYIQKTVLYLGEISGSQKKSWNKSIAVLNEDNQPVHKTLFALHDDDDICENIDAIPLTQVRQLNYFSIYFRGPGRVAGWFLDRYGG